MGIPALSASFYDNSGGLDLISSDTKVAEDDATESINMDYIVDGAATSRNGSSMFNQANQMDQHLGLGTFDYRRSDGNNFQLVQDGSKIYHNLVSPVSMVTGLNATAIPHMEEFVTSDNEYVVWGNGIDPMLKFDGTTWTGLAIVTAPTDPTFNSFANGLLNDGEYDYYVEFGRTVSGILVQESDLNPTPLAVTVNVTFTTAAFVGTPIAGAAIIQDVTGATALVKSVGLLTLTLEFVNGVFDAVNVVNGVNPDDTLFSFTPTAYSGPQQITINIPTSADPQVNARVIFRKSPTSAGIFYRLAIVPNNVTTTYTDNNPLDGTIPVSFGNQNPPLTNIFTSFLGYMLYADGPYVYISAPNKPWNVAATSLTFFDGPVNALHNCYGVCLVSTSNGTLWVFDGDPTITPPRRISSIIGALNNRCVDGPGPIYILATNHKIYALNPTDFSQAELRINEPISYRVQPYLQNISFSEPDKIVLKYYTSSQQAKVMISVPSGGNTNNNILVYNETQSFLKSKACWYIWDNINASTLNTFIIAGENVLVSTDYNGFIWKLNDTNMMGDGAEVNGTVTSATNNTLTQLLLSGTATSGGASTLTDFLKVLIDNVYTGDFLSITAGTGSGQTGRITSNTVDTFTVFPAWGVVPDNTSVYTIGPFNPSSLKNVIVRIFEGTDVNDFQTIVSNTNTTLTITSTWLINPDSTSMFTVGGFNQIHFTNWKALREICEPSHEAYDVLKQLWFFISNMNASGNYNIKLILQFDFDVTETNQINLLINLQSTNTIWDAFIWEQAPWGAQSVFQDRLRQYGRFRAIRLGFVSVEAGKPFQLNGFSLTAQNKELFYL